MHISRDNRGHLRVVRKPEDRGSHGRPNHTRPTFDRPTWPEIGRVPLPPSGGFHEPPRYPSARDPPRNIRPPARPPGPANTAHRDRPRHFDEKRGNRRRPEELFEEAFWDVSLNTGTEYPCTERDLDASGGRYRFADCNRNPRAELMAMWFSEPNTGPKVAIRQAALDIFQHNAPGRITSAKEKDAIERLCVMVDNACEGFWGPDVAIKCFCDLDTVFFRGKLRGHVCLTWAKDREFEPFTWGQTASLGHGKALIQLNASHIFLGNGPWVERPFKQMLSTLLHEMW